MSNPPAVHYFWSQVLTSLPRPTASFAGKTIIITGSNSGLGLEAARYIVSLGANKVILAVRTREKGVQAAESIEASTKRTAVIEVWGYDQSNSASVISFAERCNTLARLDVVIANAGVHLHEWTMAEGNETTVTVNLVNTMLLAVLLLPKLRETAENFTADVVLTFTGSFVHWFTTFPESKADSILTETSIESKANMFDRYNISKMMLLLAFHEFVPKLSQPPRGQIIASLINPGSVKTPMARRNPELLVKFLLPWAFRSVKEGSRTLVSAAYGEHATHGKYLCDCKPAPDSLISPWVTSEEGQLAQKKLWTELMNKLESISPGVTKNISCV